MVIHVMLLKLTLAERHGLWPMPCPGTGPAPVHPCCWLVRAGADRAINEPAWYTCSCQTLYSMMLRVRWLRCEEEVTNCTSLGYHIGLRLSSGAYAASIHCAEAAALLTCVACWCMNAVHAPRSGSLRPSADLGPQPLPV
jgi:hypothetical protein